MITAAQTDLVLELERLVDRLNIGHVYFGQIFRAAANIDDVEIARLSGMMIIELEVRGYQSTDLATKWLELFHEFIPLTV